MGMATDNKKSWNSSPTISRNAVLISSPCYKEHMGLAVNTGKTKYMEIGRHRGMRVNAHIKIGSNF